MSLNGLDNAAIKEAHEAAVAEPGGWFLLKYASRDEIDLLDRGTGGIVEIRAAIDQYDEASPLYGFLKYRRRNVIIKYMPDNCSRLVQARVAVHFNSLCEWLAPYNITFSISEAKELKDTKLSAACSLHTASSSTSSSTSSLRRRRLVEIAEEEEEEQQRATKRQSIVKEEDPSDASSPPVTLNAQLAALPDESKFHGTTEPPSFTGVDRPGSPTQSLDDRRPSSQFSRAELSSYANYNYGKPKVKLAPRPSVDTAGRRTAASTGTFRPVSSIPAGFKMLSRGSRRGRGDRRGSSQIDEDDELAENTAIPLPADPSETLDIVRPHTSAGRPSSSSGLSVRSIAATIAASKADKISPEKARLMKAMKMREKKKKLGAQTALAVPTVDVTPVEAGTVNREPTSTEDRSDAASIASAAGASTTGNLDDQSGSNAESSADSTLASTSADRASIDTQTTDSHPASPMVEQSEISDSTKASSLSESTDETVQALQDLKAEADAEENNKAVAEPETSEPETVTPKAAEAAPLPKVEQKPVEEPVKTVEKPVTETPEASRPITSATTATDVSSDLDNESSSAIPSITVQKRDSQSASAETKLARRKPDPIRTDMDMDDDDFMEELQSATVHEAKPILVSKSPVSAAFTGASPTKNPRADNDQLERTVSNPSKGSYLAPGDVRPGSARSASSGAAYLQKIAQQNASNAAAKKANTGSSIAQRIKALEKLSGSTPGPVVEAPVRAERPTSAFFAVRKPAGLDKSRSPSIVDIAPDQMTPSPPASRDSTSEVPRTTTRDRAGSMASRLSMFEGGAVPRGRPESVMVKARINRDPAQPFAKLSDANDSDDFKQSHLTVNHQKGTGMPGSVYAASASVQAATESGEGKESLRERRMSRDMRQYQETDEAEDIDPSQSRRRSSLTIVKDFIKDRRTSTMVSRTGSTDNLSNSLMSPASIANSAKSPSRPPSIHNSSLGRRLSISSRRSSTSKDRDAGTPPPTAPMSPSEGYISGDDSKSINGSSGGRASRFMRRLSSSLSNNRKNGAPTISATVTEEEEAAPQNAVSFIGDVNVQFPDNLLWKRRTMCLDSHGFLILSTGGTASSAASIVSDRPAGIVKRYHLSDFRLPYIPEMELQELPNSVCLDFIEGSSLQVACEDRTGQMNVLQILQDAHRSYQ